MEGKDRGDESPRTVLCDDSVHQRPALFTGDFLRSMLPALDGCPERSPKRQRVGVDSGGEEDRAASSCPRMLANLEDSAPHLLPAFDGCPARSRKRQRVGVDSGGEEDRAASSCPKMLANLEDSAPDLLPALDGCPARSAKHRRVGVDSGGEEDRAASSCPRMLANLEDSAPDLLPALDGCPARSAKHRRVGVDSGGEVERVTNSCPRMLANLEDSAPDLLPAVDGCPARSAKRRRVGVDSWSAKELFEDESLLDLSKRAAKVDSCPEMLTGQEVLGLAFDQLPDEVLVKILGCSDRRRRAVISTVSKNIRSLVKRNSSPCCGRFSHDVDCQLNSSARPTNQSTICSLGRDALLKIICKLTTSDIARLGRTCAGFRCPLVCLESRRFIHKYSEQCEFLGALVSCTPLSKYPVLLASLLPSQQQPAVETFAAFWRTFAKTNKLQKIEVGDCRDGRIVLRERLCKNIIICNPFALNRPTTLVREVPSYLLQESSFYVCCTLVPDDDGQNFSVIMLMVSGVTGPDGSIKIAKYVSEIDSWSCWESEVPLRSTVRLPSVLSDKKVHYLQPSVQILTVDSQLNIGRIPVPDMSMVQYHNHLLVQRKSGMLCLVAVTGRKVRVFEFHTSCSCWNISKQFDGPGDENDCRLVGSGTDRILIHAADRLWCMDLMDGRHFHVSIGSKFVREAFCYEMQHPPVAEFLPRLH